MLQAMRDMSDRLSQKYGLPIIVEPENAHSRSYSEWRLAKEGKNWKDMIRQDITYALEHSASYEEYLCRMKQLGYILRETEEHITYYTPEKNTTAGIPALERNMANRKSCVSLMPPFRHNHFPSQKTS